ncbi:short chain dehydrogenase [Pseudoclavibacter sp. RFBJ3]|nr:short chain dehydrogenase [Pseudoclavibacter sp. RFBJ5]PPF90920.1 short chain dehydrogenase [Pseudoclavibacter sp. RFBJ3]PPG00196.1 short chain dehydrogenase [Pseudoclavibacter sp. RFBH5]PPG20054.1 short chain dehydrogenase [Pseudoclavibacter sp. RFBI4]
MSGGSRGIGLAIAKRAARDGANVVLLAKTGDPHPKLPGTVYTAAEEIREAGGRALPVVGDVRDDSDLQRAVDSAVAEFGGIDIVVNNASAIDLRSTLDIDEKRYDLMHQINQRGTFMLSRAALPHLLESPDARILSLSPPLNLTPQWLGAYPAYMTAKYGMTLATLGIAAEFAERGVDANTLWPRTTIQTAAVANIIGGEELMRRSRTPELYADAAHAVLAAPRGRYRGQTLLCEDVLADSGVSDLSVYSPGVDASELHPDAFVD